MSEKENISEVEDKKLSDDELENVSGGVVIPKKSVGADTGTTLKPVVNPTKTK